LPAYCCCNTAASEIIWFLINVPVCIQMKLAWTWLPKIITIWDVLLLFFNFYFIHMCIHCLGYFSPLPPAPSLTPLLPPLPLLILATRQKLCCSYL
jgi:hypothetical protein